MDLTEVEDIKKRWQEYTEELYKKKVLMTQLTMIGWLVTYLEPDILECKVKWVLGSITMDKASGGDEIPVERYQVLKDNAVKVLHSVQFSTVTQPCLTLCDPMNRSTSGLPVHHQLLEFTQTQVH